MYTLRSTARVCGALLFAATALLGGCGGGGDDTAYESDPAAQAARTGRGDTAESENSRGLMPARSFSTATAQQAVGGALRTLAPTQNEAPYAAPVKTLDEAIGTGRIPKVTVEAARKDGSAPVIVRVRLSAPFRPEGTLTSTALEQQRQAIADAQKAVLAKIAGLKVSAVRQFHTIPSMALVADERALTALVALAEVVRIHADKLDAPQLATSTRVIGSDNVRDALGSAGLGAAVAILDTGVDKSHPFLAGRVVAEACFSGPNLYATNLCPGGSSGAYPGAAAPCVLNLCDHGTHVAGIAAGRGNARIPFDGVAGDASIIAIQMASYFWGNVCTGLGLASPCPLFPASNQIEALEHVLTLRNTFRIAAVNMSLGGGFYTDQQACDDDNQALKDIIDNLRSFQIATVVAAGNNALLTLPSGAITFRPGLAAPACISSAVSVGATSNANIVLAFSQSAPFLDLLAPGNNINSSVTGGGFGIKSGTSMAAPHVAGAFAVLRALDPALGAQDILDTLVATGLPVTDNRSGTPLSTPRLRVDSAVEALTAAPLRPTRLRVLNVTDSSIQVAWDDNSRSEVQFRIRAVPVVSGPPVRVGTGPQNAGIGTVTDLAPNQEYRLTVLACDATTAFAHCSPPSDEVRQRTTDTVPATPLNLRAGSVTSGSLTLTWDAASDHPITRFEFSGATSAQCPALTFSNGVSSGTFTRSCSGLSAGTTYQLRVRACNGPDLWHCSGWSNTVSVTTLAQGTPPGAPTNLHTCPASGIVPVFCIGPVTLLWNDNSSNETRFEFERAQAAPAYGGPPASWPDAAWIRVSLGPNTTRYTPSTVTSGALHYFRVRACDQGVCSAYSNIVSWTAQ